MNNQSDIFSQLKKTKKPNVPEGFFERFSVDINQNDFGQNLSGKAKKPKVPEDFFDSFSKEILNVISEEEKTEFTYLNKSKQPVVTENYFEEFPTKIQKILKAKKRRSKIIRISFISTIASVAASLLIIFTLQKTTQETIRSQPTQTTSFSNQNDPVEFYTAYLDETEVIDYILENDISIQSQDENNEIFEYVADDVEDYYLEL